MKTSNLSSKTLALLMATTFISSYAIANEDPLADTQAAYNSEQIDVDGVFSVKAPAKSEADKMAEERAQLEKQNEDLVRKKIEDARIAEERKMTDRLKNMFNGQSLDNSVQAKPVVTDQVVEQRASVAKVETTAPAQSTGSGLGEIKVMPVFGGTLLQGTGIDLESKIQTGLSVETMVTSRVGVELGVNYMNFQAELLPSDLVQVNTSYANNYYTNSGFNNWYNTEYNGSRQLDYKQVSVELAGKFFLIDQGILRPYVGAGASYNRTNLKYTDHQANYQGVSYGGESYSSNYVAGSAKAGMQLLLTKHVGLVVDLKYTRGLTQGFGQSGNLVTNPLNQDQAKIDQVGAQIEDANFFTATAGAVISF